MKKVTVLGGGTGTFVVLSGLKQYPLDLAVIVSMMDSGGSTGRLRDQLGVLPPGDLRQCLVALSEASQIWRELFLYRFDEGDLKGHNLGNIFISALEKLSKNYDDVINTASTVLKTKGHVIPVTHEKTHLAVEYENGKKILGEGYIDEDNFEESRIRTAYLEPQVSANPKGIERVVDSDYLIFGPGDLYTSIIPVLLPKGMRDAVKKSKAHIIYIMNLMTKPGQTTGYRASDHIADLEHYLDRQVETVLIDTSTIPVEIVDWYSDHHSVRVENDLQVSGFSGTVIGDDCVAHLAYQKNNTDILTRSILRHDSQKIAKILFEKVIR